MESLESLLRKELAEPSTGTRESVHDLVADVRRLRRRRTLRTSATATLGVVLAVILGVVVVVRGQDQRQPDGPRPTPTAIDGNAFLDLGRQMFQTVGVPVGVRFFDDGAGYLTLIRCPSGTIDDSCDARLLVTEDGGASFTQRPPLPAKATNFFIQWIFDGGTIVIDETSPVTPPGESPPPGSNAGDLVLRHRWVSSDAGRTWREVSTAPFGTVTSVPPGARLVSSWSAEPGGDTVPFVLTPDGTSYRLSTVPQYAGVVMQVDAFGEDAGYGGSLFLRGPDEGLLVSTDQGATWQSADTAGASRIQMVGAVHGWIYAAAFGETVNPTHLIASHDGGLTWSKVALPPLTPVVTPPPSPGSDLNPSTLSMAALPAGGLLLTDAARLWRLSPGGDHFEPLPGDTVHSVQGAEGVVFGYRGAGADLGLYLTTDGEHWQPVAAG